MTQTRNERTYQNTYNREVVVDEVVMFEKITKVYLRFGGGYNFPSLSR